MFIWTISTALIFGFFSKSLFGFILGLIVGPFIYRFFNQVAPVREDHSEHAQKSSKVDKTLFFDVLYETMGALCKLKGRITAQDIAYVSERMDHMRRFGSDRKRVQDAFNYGKGFDYSFSARIDQLYRYYHNKDQYLEYFCEEIIQAAAHTGSITESQLQMILQITSALKIPRHRVIAYIQSVLDSHQSQSYQRSFETNSRQKDEDILAEAYRTLKVSPNSDVQTIKRAYRKLMNEYHPDKLVSKGLTKQQLDAANKKAQKIQFAYDTIKKERQFK